MIGFYPSLLQLVITDVELPIRQAAAIYLKNSILSHWNEKKSGMEFSIHDKDREIIRDSIIDAIVIADDLIASHLAVCINHIIKHDGPEIVKKVPMYLQAPDSKYWMGALLALHQLVKVYEYKNAEGRMPLDEAMRVFLPLTYTRCVQLLPDNSERSVLIQKQIMKIFHGFVLNTLPLDIITRDVFTQWVQVFLAILERPVPDSTNQLPYDERDELIWWKCKKWVVHILSRIFERYGSPENVDKKYQEFAGFYIKTFSPPVIGQLLKILEQEGNKQYVDPRVLRMTLNYFNTAVDHSFTWKIIKPHMILIVQSILFPLMCHSEQDADLWSTDPQEYIRLRYDPLADYISPVAAAQKLLHTCCARRKDMLQKILAFVVQVLNDGNAEPQMKDGALHIVGSIANILLKKKMYQDQIEDLLVTYAFPYFQSPHGYLRARACWVLSYFAQTKFQQESNSITALQSVEACLLNEKELPVKVQAALCLQSLASSQERLQKLIENSIAPITFSLLSLIRETENEDLTACLQKFVCFYPEQMVVIAVEMVQHLAQTFYQLLETKEDESDDKALTAMGLMHTIDTILTVTEDRKDIESQLERIVVPIVFRIYQEELMDLYEEALTLICTMSSNNISPDLWRIYELMYQVFKKEGFEYFDDMMPALHNFITVDPASFVSNRNHVLAMYDMCKTVMNNDSDEEVESYAAKILECMILQFKGQIDDCIKPFVELVLDRLTREVKNTSLKTICLQVVIAAFYYNPILLLDILEGLQPINSNRSLFSHFLHQWLNDTSSFVGLHDRKMCVLGLITLMALSPEKRPSVINEACPRIVPTILELLKDLKLAYKSKANAEKADDSDLESEEDDEEEVEELDDDEDHVSGTEYFRSIVKKVGSSFPITSTHIEDIDADVDDDDDEEEYSDDEDDEFNQTQLESYSTTLDNDDTDVDEYVAFKETLEMIQRKDPNWYNALMQSVDSERQRILQEVFVLANQRKAAAGQFNFAHFR